MKAGLLPLYIKLYDDFVPFLRERLESFYEKVAAALESRGIEVILAPFCRELPEFEETVKTFETESADAIITLHMAYSPSLESAGVLAGSALPIIVLDTTETSTFTNTQDAGEINYNHGIHGVMDLCSMLIRLGKPYAIAAGHYEKSDCLDRVEGFLRAAVAARALQQSKVGLFGPAFPSMGDFAVPYEEMQARFGIQAQVLPPEQVEAVYDSITEAEIAAEKAENAVMFTLCTDTRTPDYDACVRACLAVRKCIDLYGLSAFSATFLHMETVLSGLPTMPFLECCKAMSRGIGYAGEGDALTAAFTGALLQGYPETNFVEIFCPDWENDMVFLSHMGEMNYRIADNKPALYQNALRYAGDYTPYAAYARMKGGKGVYLNVSRGKEDFKLVLASAQMLCFQEDSFQTSMRGWMKTEHGTAELLEKLSRHGATHHSVFIYDAMVEQMAYFGALLGLETVVI